MALLQRTWRHVRQLAQTFTPSQFTNNLENFLFPSLQLAGHPSIPSSYQPNESPSLFDWAIWLAAPKSKIPPSRKKMKHFLYYPDKVPWMRCNKCGEPKRPHRICTDNVEICAMRDDEYEAHMKAKAAANDTNP
ncbi:50S ribosomal protein L32 [archaeon]|nr:MAG: 50S ribosomal protein L32 [archaeon]